MPYNFFNRFKEACRHDRKNIIQWGGVENDADDHFSLRTQTQIHEFIAQGGIEEIIYQNKKPWENNPNPNNPVDVYAYNFRTGYKIGYIAIMRIELSKKWIIKSFKLSEKRDSESIKLALKMPLIGHKGKNNE